MSFNGRARLGGPPQRSCEGGNVPGGSRPPQSHAFDKTGTLTEGHPKVLEVIPLGSFSEGELLRVAGALESQSGHPLAQVILSHVRSQGNSFPAAQGFQALQRKVAKGTVDGHPYWLGSYRHLEEGGLETPEVQALLEAQEAESRTLVAFGMAN